MVKKGTTVNVSFGGAPPGATSLVLDGWMLRQIEGESDGYREVVPLDSQ